MHTFELLPEAEGARVKAVGSTRAALLEAALQGMFAAAAPRYADPERPVERPFAVKSVDFPALLVDFLDQALSRSDANREAYRTVRFDLVTGDEAKGAFIGAAADGFEMRIKAASRGGLAIGKNEEGNWETAVTLET